jgi:hypothetical protein
MDQIKTGTINFVQIETETGIKEFELFYGDIVNLPFKTDLTTISAFKNDYIPTSESIIGQFFNKGINIEKLSKKPFLDFRENLGIWVTDKTKDENYNYIICVEITGNNNSFEKSIRNLFSVISTLEIQGIQNKTIALPLLGSGDQAFDLNHVIPTIINISLDFLRYSRFLNKVIFVVRCPEKVKLLNSSMNHLLGRKKLNRNNTDLSELLKRDLNHIVNQLLKKQHDNHVLVDFKRILNTNFEPFEFGAISRKLIENIIEKINPESKKQFELFKKIDNLNNYKVAQWIQSYLHVIRIFGNEAVHNKDISKRKPEYLDYKDLEIGIYCIIRILEFYNDSITEK